MSFTLQGLIPLAIKAALVVSNKPLSSPLPTDVYYHVIRCKLIADIVLFPHLLWSRLNHTYISMFLERRDDDSMIQ